MRIRRDRLFSIVFAFYPLLAMYGFGSVTFGDILLIVALAIGTPANREQVGETNNHVKILWVYMVWCLISIMLNMFRADFLLGSVIKRVIKMVIYLYAITASRSLLDKQQFIKCYRYLVNLTFAGLLIQYLAYYGMGKVLVIRIPFLPYSGVVSEESIYIHLVSQFRPGAFFSEPAACCYVLLPFFIFSLFSEKDNHLKSRDIAISGVSILLTVSSAGVVCLFVALGFYFMNLLITRQMPLSRKLLIISASCVMIVVAMKVYTQTPLYYALERMQRTEENSALANAVWGKTTAGAALMTELEGVTKCFGMGFGNLSMANLSDYTNSINYIIYCTGYIGIAILVIWVLVVFFGTKNAGKATIAVFVALSVSSRIFISYLLMYYAVFCQIDDKYSLELETTETQGYY